MSLKSLNQGYSGTLVFQLSLKVAQTATILYSMWCTHMVHSKYSNYARSLTCYHSTKNGQSFHARVLYVLMHIQSIQSFAVPPALVLSDAIPVQMILVAYHPLYPLRVLFLR